MVRISSDLVETVMLIHYRGMAKTADEALTRMISHIRASDDKLSILQHLTTQMDLLMNDGQTSPNIYRQYLQSAGWITDRPRFATKKLTKDVSSLECAMRESCAKGQVRTLDKSFTFDIKHLRRLKPTTWFEADLILLCLHLSQKHAYVRIGYSVPLHQDDPAVLRINPLQIAAQMVKKWHAAEGKSRLVSFFPLFLRGDHFSLLEVNEIDGCIYYYDTLERGDKADVRVRDLQKGNDPCGANQN